MTTDEKYMKQAIKQAKKAYAIDEVPIGCIIVRDEDGKVIARGYNRRNTDKNTLSHAELNAIRKASKKLGDWRLRLHDVCDAGTLSDVRRCPGAVTDRPRGDREYEPESRLCRIGIESASDRRI